MLIYVRNKRAKEKISHSLMTAKSIVTYLILNLYLNLFLRPILRRVIIAQKGVGHQNGYLHLY